MKIATTLAAIPVAAVLCAGIAHSDTSDDQELFDMMKRQGIPTHGAQAVRAFGRALLPGARIRRRLYGRALIFWRAPG